MDIKQELPVLLDGLNSGSPDGAAEAARLLGALALFQIRNRPLLRVAVPSMISLLNYPDRILVQSRPLIIDFVAMVEPNPPDSFIKLMLAYLHDGDLDTRESAVSVLGQMKPLPAGILHTLLGLMSEPGPPLLKGRVIQALGQNKVADPEAVQAITTALEDKNAYVQSVAAAALMEIGSAAKTALPALRRLAATPGADENAVSNARGALMVLEEQQP